MGPVTEILTDAKLMADTIFGVRTIIAAFLSDLRRGKVDPQTIENAEKTFDRLAELEKAVGIGLPLCPGHLPTRAMIAVGARLPEGDQERELFADTVRGGIARGSNSIPTAIVVHECPQCGFNDAFFRPYHRFASPRSSQLKFTYIDDYTTVLECSAIVIYKDNQAAN